MHRLGISIYPQHSTKEKDDAYMRLAASYGFTRLFTCMLSSADDTETMIQMFSDLCTRAHQLGMIVSVDTNPRIFKKLGADPLNLKVFKDMGVDIIRMDGHFSDLEDIALTLNPYDIQIEFNGSQYLNLDRMIEKGANPHNMTICHNFYPMRYSGLSEERFHFFNSKTKTLNLTNAAFVSSNEENTFGPWPVYEGLPTLELCRDKAISWQTRYLYATREIDDVLIGNAFASEAELKAMADADPNKVTVKIDLDDTITEIEKKIVFDCLHNRRSDSSDLLIRTVDSRMKYHHASIPQRVCDKAMFTVGDVVIVNDALSHYRAELQIILKPIPNTGDRNLAGHLNEDEMKLVSMIAYENIFGFIQ